MSSITTAGRIPAVDRQAERRFGDERIARHRLERRAGRVGGALVVAGDDPDAFSGLDPDLRRSEDVPGRMETDATSPIVGLARRRAAIRSRRLGAEPAAQQRRARVGAQIAALPGRA